MSGLIWRTVKQNDLYKTKSEIRLHGNVDDTNEEKRKQTVHIP